MATVILKKGEGRLLKTGGLWIFDNEIDRVLGEYADGDIVEVRDFDEYPMGKGFINSHSKIRVRMLSRDINTVIDRAFIHMRVKNAWDYRKSVMQGQLSSCRVVFGEADFLPGIVIDKYENVLVVEALALGIDKLKELIVDELKAVLAEDGYDIIGVYERSDAKERKKEGLSIHKGFMGPEFNTDIQIVENGVHYLVDVVNGQKTGFFLDQKFNRLAMQHLIAGMANSSGQVTTKCTPAKQVRVLDCFTHMGTFALNCGLAGATDVTGLDISEYAVKQATENAKRNGLSDRVKFKAANVLDELPRLYKAGEKYDVVILDPPAFTKSREATKNAIKGYREINMKGMRLIKDGGYLATCSCSHFMTQELFAKTIKEAAAAVHKRLRQVQIRTQAADHPILWAANESYYLKFFIFQVVDEK